ncbi:MAG: hypothetical protein ACLQIB_33985 [Isosphaeraceae bacterium]
MAITPPIAVHDYEPGGLEAALTFLKRARDELRQLRRVRAARDVVRIFDVNNDIFEIRGLGYADADLVPILRSIGGVFNPDTIHQPTTAEFKEFKTGRCHPWAEDRVL